MERICLYLGAWQIALSNDNFWRQIDHLTGPDSGWAAFCYAIYNIQYIDFEMSYDSQQNKMNYAFFFQIYSALW